jgi:hypothetical protein
MARDNFDMRVEEDRFGGPQDSENIPIGQLGWREVADNGFQLIIDMRALVEGSMPLDQFDDCLLVRRR